ncbi:MAG: DUF3224 domain-containing protein [Corynebacteriales bacterium]|nr:DUF3224 domain-containing protein [Mycobacteriales bacterium]
MFARGVFSVEEFMPAAMPLEKAPKTALDLGLATILKKYSGEVHGISTALFSSAYNETSGQGTYVAIDAFEGSLNGLAGTFNYAHASSTTGNDRANEFFLIVPASGTGELTGITGNGGITIDEDGTHRIEFDYELPEQSAEPK